MKVTVKSRRHIRLQNILFVTLFVGVIGILAWLSTRYHYQADWTANGRNTLSAPSVAVLSEIKAPLKVKVFVTEMGPLKQRIEEVLRRYQRHKADMQLEFINPDTDPDLVRKLAITMNGEMVFEYQGRSEKLAAMDEQSITNVLQRLSRSEERWLVFLEGHGERSPFGQANHDLQTWATELEAKGLKLKGVNLATQPLIPDNTAVLVIAGPQVNYLPGEVTLINEYLHRGGNLLWLADPDGLFGLDAVADQVGVALQPGTIVDPTTQMFAINNPTFAIVGEYGMHPVTKDFNVLTIFPMAAGLTFEPRTGWQGESFLTTTEKSWSETGVLAGEIDFDASKDIAGPLTIGISATRTPHDEHGEHDEIEKSDVESSAREQRVVVIGDGDFLSNAYVGNGGNLNLGMNIINWLSRDDQLLSIPAKTAPDTSLSLSKTDSLIIGFGFLLVLPLLLLLSGLVIWLKRRKA
ncbi:MAG: Gldg family protein [Pseudomonadota bacterium]|nr:Gldg family protein [Pseudomonadota bacterium]